jgi:hypothetical protein
VNRTGSAPIIGGFAAGALLLVWGLATRQSAEPAADARAPAAAAAHDPPERPGEITTRSLLRELVDLGALARLPDPPYEARFESSYDRRSRTPADTEGWFANDDWASAERPNYPRKEQRGNRTEYVLLDAKGPGAIVRLWSASPAGTLRIYFDGRAEPEIEEEFDGFVSGKGSIPEPFSYVAAKGKNSYLPLPFRNGCKITIDSLVSQTSRGEPLEKVYYQVQYRSYAPDSAERVRTFRRGDLQGISAEPAVTQIFEKPWTAYEPSPRSSRHAFTSSGDELTLSLERPGGAAVRELNIIVRDVTDAALRNARFRASFDAETTIDVPLGDFFAQAPGLYPYDTLPFTIRADGSLTCRFPMPFQERASFTVTGSRGAAAELVLEPDAWSERSLHFHARHRPPATLSTRPPSDLALVKLSGQGHYVGDAFNIQNPAPRWWGEGDDKIYVDGDAFPRCFGTGTEDYYGYAWSTTEVFTRALHAQPRVDNTDFSGRISNNRFRTLDAIPFQRSLRFDMELWHWEETRVTWDAMLYFYARPGLRVE